MPTILVTGSTGTFGSSTVQSLLGKPGVTVRAAVHTRLAEALPDSVERVHLDYDEPDSIRVAAQGADAVLLITPGGPGQPELAERALDALQAARVPHLVRFSVIGAERKDARLFQREHARTEQEIVASGIPYTFLRPNGHMLNFLDYYAPDPEGNIRLPWGKAGVSHIDARDVGDVAAHVLTTEGHDGKAYTLTGPEALTMG